MQALRQRSDGTRRYRVTAAPGAGALLAAIALAACCIAAPPERSRAELAAFKRDHPCPATGQARGACPGWEVDHVVPLCNGGPDKPANMQWLTVEAHREKTRTDVAVCAARRADQRRP